MDRRNLSEKDKIQVEKHLDIARKLCKSCDCVLMGSMALYLEFWQVLDYVPGDVDLLTDAELANLRKMIRVLRDEGFRVFSWQDEIDESVEEELLKGRFYIRGVKNAEAPNGASHDASDNTFNAASIVTVDITYEIAAVEWQKVKDCFVEIDGIRVFEKDVLIAILRGCPKEKKQEQARRLCLL